MRILIVTLVLAGAAWAQQGQNGPRLVAEPWEKGKNVEVSFEIERYLEGTVDQTGADFQQTWYRLNGRARTAQHPGAFVIGWDFAGYNFQSSDPAVPKSFVDSSLAVAFPIMGPTNGWALGGVVGGGFAGDNPYADGNAWYGLADIAATKIIDKNSRWILDLNFNGNRIIFPDLPLPVVQYARRTNNGKWFYLVGFPFISVTFEPTSKWEFDFRWFIVNVNGGVKFKPTEKWEIYARIDRFTNAFHLQGLSGNRRVFYRQRKVEVGVRFKPSPAWDINLGVGYAFDQEFRTGWDIRGLTTVASVSDEPYLAFRVTGRF